MNPTTTPSFPARSHLTICFAHVAYQMQEIFTQRDTGIRHFETRTTDQTKARMAEVDVLTISTLWSDELLDHGPKLRFIQSIGAGYDQFPTEQLKQRGIRLASAGGANVNAVGEHVFALTLGLFRKIHNARDHQHRRFFRPTIANIADREDELAGKTLGVIGLGRIGSKVARLGKAFDMRVVATKRDPTTTNALADIVLPANRLDDLLSTADVVVICCPLTPQTRGLLNADSLAKMKQGAVLINVARGACVDETALAECLLNGKLAGAGLDCFASEPLAAHSPLWTMDQVIITPHTAGETRVYESNVIDILLENIVRLERGDKVLLNEV